MSTDAHTPTKEVADDVQDGDLPHQILLRAARGEPFIRIVESVEHSTRSYSSDSDESTTTVVEELYYPTYAERIDAAKAAAPYYAPRLATQIISSGDNNAENVIEAMKLLAAKLPV